LRKQKESFYNTISFEIDKEKSLEKIDKTISKFLQSDTNFPNINYTEMSTKPFQQQFNYFFVYLLCFKFSFEHYGDAGNVFFYSDNLEFSYFIKKKLKSYKNKIINNKNKNKNSIFKITWQQIMDTLVEYKSSWSLENMYIISYKKLSNRTQEDVKYIGIPKLQASILLEDSIREAIDIRVGKYWIIEEFIKGKPLYPIILEQISKTNNNTNFNYFSVVYALITEANISNFKNSIKNNKILFAEDYFDNYRSLVNDIKKDVRYSSFKANLINQISKDKDYKNRIARDLVEALKAKDKNMFLNILFKNMNENKDLCANSNLNNWIFEKIVENDISYEMYGLLLVSNLYGGKKHE
jgi:hypothetical protein